MAEMNSEQRPYVPQRQKYLLSGTAQKKCIDPGRILTRITEIQNNLHIEI